MKASMREEVQCLLRQVGKDKKAKKLAEKFYKTGTLSRRDLKILMRLAEKRRQVA